MKELSKYINFNLNKSFSTKILSLLMIVILLITGVFGVFLWLEIDSATPSRLIWGTTNLDSPLSHASISIYDMNNKEFCIENCTSMSGSFIFEFEQNLLDWKGKSGNFIIHTTGGIYNGKEFNGTLKSIAFNHINGEYLIINIITTIIAGLMERHPYITYDDAEATVKAFLSVPTEIDIVEISEYDDIYFNSSIFMKEVTEYGEFNGFVDHLLDEIEMGSTHAFRVMDNHVIGIIAKAFLKRGLKYIGSGILSTIENRAFGWLVDSILGIGDDPDSGQKKILKQIKQVNKQMHIMKGELKNIQKSVSHLEQGQREIMNRLTIMTNQMESQLEALAEELKVEVTELTAYQELLSLKNRRTTIITHISDPISAITTAYNKLYRLSHANLANDTYKKYQEQAEKYINEILSIRGGIEYQLERIHDNLVSELGEDGVLEVWTQIATKTANEMTNITQIYQDFENRFSYLLAVELKGMNMVVEAYHARFGNDTNMAEQFWNTWKDKIRQQIVSFQRCVDKMLYTKIDTLTSQELNRLPPTGSSYSSSILRKSDEFALNVLDGLICGIVRENETIHIKLKAPNGKYVYQTINDNNLIANSTTMHDAATFEITSIKDGVSLKAASNGKFIGLVGDKLVAQFNIINANSTLNIVDLGNGSITIKGPNEKYISLTHETPQKLVAVENDLSQNEIFEVIHASGEITVQFVNYPQFSEKSFDQMNISLTLENGDSIFEPYSIVRSNDHTLLFYNASLSKHESVSYEVIHFHFHVPFGTYHLTNMESKYPYMIRHIDYRHNLTISNTEAYQTLAMTAYIPTQPKVVTQWEMDIPGMISIDNESNIYTASYQCQSVKKFNSTGNLINEWGTLGIGPGQFWKITALSVSDNGYVYVVDQGESIFGYPPRIQKFDGDGNFITQWGSYGSGEGQFIDPQGIAIDNKDNVYVLDFSNSRIQKFDGEGSFIAQWGSEGSGEGQFEGPRDIDVDSMGNVYVVDTGNNRIQKFKNNGTFITQWGSQGSGKREFNNPEGIEIDHLGNVYIADGDNHRIQVIDNSGVFITQWGSEGSGEGEFDFPSGIAVDNMNNMGNFYIADFINNRIQKFRYQFTIVP